MVEGNERDDKELIDGIGRVARPYNSIKAHFSNKRSDKRSENGSRQKKLKMQHCCIITKRGHRQTRIKVM